MSPRKFRKEQVAVHLRIRLRKRPRGWTWGIKNHPVIPLLKPRRPNLKRCQSKKSPWNLSQNRPRRRPILSHSLRHQSFNLVCLVHKECNRFWQTGSLRKTSFTRIRHHEGPHIVAKCPLIANPWSNGKVKTHASFYFWNKTVFV